jgi:nucleotide-binding universal stress UspA family protein
MHSLKNIICPIDFSPTSYEALKGAEQLALRVNAELILLHVISFPAPNKLGFKSEQEASNYARENAEKKLKEIIATSPSNLVGARFIILNGSPAGQYIVDAARSEAADLIVMGTHGWTGWRHLVLGSVTEEVMHFADCPVLTVHAPVSKFAGDGSPLKILCPTDFSEPSLQALKIAGEMALSLDAQVSLMHVMNPASMTFGELSAQEFDQLRDGTATRAMVPLIKEHLPLKLQAAAQSNRLLRRGRPEIEIVRAAEEGDFDLIVMATQGETGWRRFFVGSIASAVVRNALCPVLTVGHGVSEKSDAAVTSPENKTTEEKTKTTIIHQEALSEASFPHFGSPEEKLHFLLRYAILAPSNRNSQPWLWKINGDTAELYADRTRALPHLDPDNRELILSCGAALLHLRLALRQFGFKDEVKVFPDQNDNSLLAVVRLMEDVAASPEEEQLFRAIPLRHTNRHPFIERALPDVMKVELQTEAKREGTRLLLIEDTQTRFAIIKLIALSSRAQGHDPQFVEETLNWLKPLDSRIRSADGIPQEVTSGGLLSHNATDVGRAQSEKDELLAWSAPLLVVLQTDDDRPRDWLAAGQALARVLLRAAADGVQASFFNGPVETVATWPKLHQVLKHAGLPQIILRFGYPSQESVATPRRQVDDVLKVGSFTGSS